MTRTKSRYVDSSHWQTLRKRVVHRDGGICVICGSDEGIQVDHIIEQADWPEGVPGLNDMENLRTLCGPHHREKSAVMHSGRAARRRGEFLLSPDPHPSPPVVSTLPPDPSSSAPGGPEGSPDPVFDPTDPAWSAVPWVWDLLSTKPENASFPRLMTDPHPLAVGTLLPEFEAWLPTFGVTLRWWQRLVAARLLEVDADGNLVWWEVILSTARQVGKSTLIRAILMWLIQQEHRWNDVRDAVFISKDVIAAKEILRPAQLWVRRTHPTGWTVKEANGELDVAYQGNRWMVRSRDAAYGYSAAVVVADEAWRLPAAIIEEGVEPLLVERMNSLLLLVSTAHRLATSLMRTRRAKAISQIKAPQRVLIVEWSAPPGTALDDEAAQRAASPHWSERRRALIAEKVEAALSGQGGDVDEPDPTEYVRAQWLDIWPPTPIPRPPGVALVEEAVWDDLRVPGLHIPTEGVVAALEASVGHPPGIAVAWRDADGQICVLGMTRPSLEAGWAALGGLPPGTSFLVGLSWRTHQKAQNLGAVGVGSRETEQALPLVQDLVKAGGLVWDGEVLGEQMRALRVIDAPASAGKSVVRSATPTHVARAAAWAIWRLDQAATPAPVIW